jgi:hypothetical protein
MERYIVPRRKRRHLVVEENVHVAVHLYAGLRGISLVEATYQLLKLGLAQAVNIPIPKHEIDRYRITEPVAQKLQRWLHKNR